MSRNDPDRPEDEYGQDDDSLIPTPGSVLAWPAGVARYSNNPASEDTTGEYGDGQRERYDDARPGDTAAVHDHDAGEDGDGDGDGTWLDEATISLLIVVGAVLFVFPEPATSGLGILLISVGALAWLVDALV